ncbi:uncharacterized protein LOC141673112 [Apium graveolens]|uniref:uncharacterized protein LOC141673112 n=1 Tax=Apium graveolens TaxID=4045 RepID=UPI003D7A50A6
MEPNGVAIDFRKMESDYRTYMARITPSHSHSNIPSSRSWSAPATGRIKENVDAHLNNGNGVCFGVVIRDDRGRLLAAAVKRICGIWSSEMAEAGAALYGLLLTRRLGFDSVVLESDALNLVSAVNQNMDGASPVFLFYNDIGPV